MFKLFKRIFFRRKKFIVYDDVFPNPLSAFRYKEFLFYLENIDDITIYTSGYTVRLIDKKNNDLKTLLSQFRSLFPNFKTKVKPINRFTHFKASLAFSLFLSNTYLILPYLTYYKTPFVFTLYPGGGFRLNNSDSDRKLTEIFRSKYFRKVIVTQQVTYDYLIRKGFCEKDKIHMIFGNVATVPSHCNEKKYYPTTKSSIDICFCANKYSKRGEDKGYDLFIESAKILGKTFDFVNFHVIGGFDENDICVKGLPIYFYGPLETEKLNLLFKQMDIIVSPNRNNILDEGSFDGFPLGSCVQAGLNGVLILATDVFNERIRRFSDQEIICIDPSVEDIIEKTSELIENPDLLYDCAFLGSKKLHELYNDEAQLEERLKVINSILSK